MSTVADFQKAFGDSPLNGYVSAANARAMLKHWGREVPEWLVALPDDTGVLILDGKFQEPK